MFKCMIVDARDSATSFFVTLLRIPVVGDDIHIVGSTSFVRVTNVRLNSLYAEDTPSEFFVAASVTCMPLADAKREEPHGCLGC